MHGLLAGARQHLARRPPTSSRAPGAAPRGVVADALAERSRRAVVVAGRARRSRTASPASKSPSTSTHADRQQARAALAHRARRAGVDQQRPARGLGVLQPQLERAVARLARGKARALALAGEHRRAAPPARSAVADHRRDARRPSPCRRRRPSSASRPSRAARSCGRSRARRSAAKSSTSRTICASGYRRGSAVKRPSMSVSRTSSLGRHEHRDLRGEEVVVAEGDLVGRGRVVLVDDRQHAPLEQRRRASGARSGSACARSCRRTSAAPARSSPRARAAARRRSR